MKTKTYNLKGEKTMKKTKFTALVLASTLLLSSAFCLSATAQTTPEVQAETKPEIISKNIAYEGNFALMLAIDPDTVAGEGVSVEVFADAAETDSVGTFTAELKNWTIGGVKKDYYTVKTSGISAKDMATQFYFRAIDKAGNAGDLERYSVAEYFYERTYLCENTQSQLNMYNTSLAMGAAAEQLLRNENEDTTDDVTTFVTEYKLVTVTGGGKLSDGYTQGIYAGEVTLVPDAGVTKWKVTDLITNKESLAEENTIALESHISVVNSDGSDINVFKRGSGVYFNKYKDNSLVYDDHSSFDTLNSTSIVRIKTVPSSNGETTLTSERVYVKTLAEGDKVLGMHLRDTSGSSGQQPALLFNLMNNEADTTTYVFESDVWFGTPGDTANISNGRKSFGFDLGSNFASDTEIKSMDAFGSNYGSYVKMQVNSDKQFVNYYFEDTTLGKTYIEAEEWHNIRVTFNTADGEFNVYLDNVLVYAKTYSSVTSVTGFTVAANRYIGGNMAIRFDNTYCGTYTE